MTTATITSATRRRPFLRLALKLDALVTGANGAAYLVAAGPLGELLGLSPALLRGTGAFLVAFAAAVWLTATRPSIPRGAVHAIVAANAIWAIDSIVAAIAELGHARDRRHRVDRAAGDRRRRVRRAPGRRTAARGRLAWRS